MRPLNKPQLQKPCTFTGVSGSAAAWLISQLSETLPRLLIVTKDQQSAEELVLDLECFAKPLPVVRMPAGDTLPFEPHSPLREITATRHYALWVMHHEPQWICVVPSEALLQNYIPAADILGLTHTFAVGMSFSKERVATLLASAGYQLSSLVEEIGEYAIRGLVIDLFPGGASLPVRLQFEGDEITAIKTFDPESQRSLHDLEQIVCPPAQEVFAAPHANAISQRILAGLENVKARGTKLGVAPRTITAALEAFRTGKDLAGLEPLMAEAIKFDNFFSLIPADVRTCLVDFTSIQNALDSTEKLITERETKLLQEGALIPERTRLYRAAQEVTAELTLQSPLLVDSLGLFTTPSELETPEAKEPPAKSTAAEKKISPQPIRIRCSANTELSIKLKTRVGSGKGFQPLRAYISAQRKAANHVLCVVGSQVRAERLQSILLDLGIDAAVSNLFGGETRFATFRQWSELRQRYPVAIIGGHLTSGFRLPEENLAVIAEQEVFGERSYRNKGTRKASLKRLLGTLAQLTDGDLVVHTDYGVGCYRGLQHLEIENIEGDFLTIEYLDSRLYLPVQHIGKVQKFQAGEGQNPQLDKLGSQRWVKTKEKVRDSVMSLAGDLIRLYATRSVVKGWHFEPKGAEDERFADYFSFNETHDQMKAIDDTLADMGSDRPMDRLVCGDVGFGKTEVAIRAAFKCTQHGRQVAVLVPTTILVEQHLKNFQERFRDYPVTVKAISRFYDGKENKETIRQLDSGEVDIVIGTHRLLSRDVQIKDLGLLIIDEEHRFGVQQKERLKAIKKNVDVLTLTATPIPRTLHMSLLGIRDVSLIATPPNDRKVIRTTISQQNKELVREALLRELHRSGQSFYVHNRVVGIDLLTAELQELVPEARFEFAHGQMSETQLENIMQRFVNREIDVLVTTTIIESGLDVPNANTIVIERADCFGLAQLYQLRGRVGRSTRQAFAYLLVPSRKHLSADALKRLKVLESLDDLGMGFSLAVRDLEIRGAGNLLGKEQSGAVLAVGFELYSKILKEAVLNLKGEELSIEEVVDPELKLGIAAFLPEWYIPDVSERLVMYQRLAAVTSAEEVINLQDELVDRFGKYGVEVQNLLDMMTLRALLRSHGVAKLETSDNRLLFSFSPKAPLDLQRILKLCREVPTTYRFSKNLTLSVAVAPPVLQDAVEMYRMCREILQAIRLTS